MKPLTVCLMAGIVLLVGCTSSQSPSHTVEDGPITVLNGQTNPAGTHEEADAVLSLRIFNRYLGIDETLSPDEPENRVRIEDVLSALNNAEWLESDKLRSLPFPPPPGGAPAVTVTYANGNSVTIEYAYRCHPDTTPPECQRVPDAIVINGRPAHSVALNNWIGGSDTKVPDSP